MRAISALFLVIFVFCVFALVLWTSLDFQECIKSYAANNPAAEHLKKSVSVFISPFPSYRHCIGAYVTDKNAVITALGTSVIAVFTTVLGIFTISLAHSTRIAANAAELSAKAAFAIELPIIRVVPDRFGYGSSRHNDGPRIEYCMISTLDFSNGGRTKAIPVEVRCGGFVGDKLPNVPAYTFTKSFPIDIFFEPSPAAPSQLWINDFEIALATGDTKKLMNRQTNLWFYCCVVYLDFMETRHEAGFCWQIHELSGGGKLLPDATPAYNRKT
jgi:hypothetical protein